MINVPQSSLLYQQQLGVWFSAFHIQVLCFPTLRQNNLGSHNEKHWGRCQIDWLLNNQYIDNEMRIHLLENFGDLYNPTTQPAKQNFICILNHWTRCLYSRLDCWKSDKTTFFSMFWFILFFYVEWKWSETICRGNTIPITS